MSEIDFKAPVVTRRNRLVIGNWKMNGSLAANHELLAGVSSLLAGDVSEVTVAVCPPSVYIGQVSGLLQETSVSWGGQDVSAHESGAYTGEVSATMLADFGCRWVIVGHSERRAMHGESTVLVSQKATAAANAGVTPVFCVGETLEQRDAGQLESVLAGQLTPLFDVGDELVKRCVIAYEPVWAIGTGRTASPEQAQDVHAFIRESLPVGCKDIPLLYGGSVKPDNAALLFAMPDIDGGLIGGAALKASDFVGIVKA